MGKELQSRSTLLPTSFEELQAAVAVCLSPDTSWKQAAMHHWLGRECSSPDTEQQAFALTLLQIEELSELLLDYRVSQLSLPPENQDQSLLTPERLGIYRDSLLYHPARRALAPVTVVTRLAETTTIHALLNGTSEPYAAGRRLHPKYAHYEGRFGYGVLDTRGRTLWHTIPSGERLRNVNDITILTAKPRTYKTYDVGKSLKFIREQGLEHSVAFSLLFDEEKRIIAQHRLLFCRFHEMDLETNPSITIGLSEGILTLRSDVFVWGVFLGQQNETSLADNVFDLLPHAPYSLPWDEDISGPPTIRCIGNSLF